MYARAGLWRQAMGRKSVVGRGIPAYNIDALFSCFSQAESTSIVVDRVHGFQAVTSEACLARLVPKALPSRNTLQDASEVCQYDGDDDAIPLTDSHTQWTVVKCCFLVWCGKRCTRP